MSNKILLRRTHEIVDRQFFEGTISNRGYWKEKQELRKIFIKRRALSYTFSPHFHPYVGALIQRLIRRSVRGLQAADTEYLPGQTIDGPGGRKLPRPKLYEEFFNAMYGPAAAPPKLPDAEFAENFQPGVFVNLPHPVKDLDFSSKGAYSVYNWELFYHVPLAVALQLSKNQRFEEARQWLHFIFDPTDDSDGPTPDRFWKVRPFHKKQIEKIEEVLVNLSTQTDPQLYEETINSIGAWKDSPFRPHVVARYRQTAYMHKAVMAYLDNLIAWGDTLFAQDSGESINEAMQYYVMAANILGPRPQAVPKKGNLQTQTYNSIRNKNNEFSSPMVKIQNDLLFDLAPLPSPVGNQDGIAAISSIGTALYFCIPRNEKLMAYWDTVADRLFKIRNSLNLQGIFRQLPLFDPPIDPALLARAAAAGVDIGSAISGLNTPLPLVRFNLLFQKAVELCQEVKSLGNQILSAFEKEDNETLALIRARHEEHMLQIGEAVRYAQWQEVIKNREGILQNISSSFERYKYYERLQGKAENDIVLPEIEEIEGEKLLTKFKFVAEEPALINKNVKIDIARNLNETGGKKVSSFELKEIEKLKEARDLQDVVQSIRLGGQAISLLPQFGIKFHFWGLGGMADYGGFNLGQLANFAANVTSAVSELRGYEANNAAKIGSFDRREQEWAFQSNSIAGEITQQFKQLRAAQIREHIAEREWKNHQVQIKNSKEIKRFLEGEKLESGEKKFSTRDFYTWMKREVKGLYSEYYKFAIEVAKKAERALQHELADPALSFIKPSYLSGKEGLLAGEKLYLDLKRMEMSFHDLNRREYELTKHVSMMQISPQALVTLRNTGQCTFVIPEEAFDLDKAGHYFRRIKTVAVSIPCVVGPYTGVHCTLTLTKSSIRTKTNIADGYGRISIEDERFSNNFSSIQSIVTSTGQNDSGMFETNLRDERYLPFEGSGVISEWQLELPKPFEQFDYQSISDVILHIRYTAREGGALLKRETIAHVGEYVAQTGFTRLFSMRHEFPMAWNRYLNELPNGTAALDFELKPEHYPFWAKGSLKSIKSIEAFEKLQDEQVEVLDINSAENIGLKANTDEPIGDKKIQLGNKQLNDVFLLLTWGAD